MDALFRVEWMRFFEWNECAISIGMAALFQVEWLRFLEWNECAFWSGMSARFRVDFASVSRGGYLTLRH
jgi:hypothetical protein